MAETTFASVRDEKKKAPEGALKVSGPCKGGMRGSGPVWAGNAGWEGGFSLTARRSRRMRFGLCREAAQRLRRRPLARTCFR